MFVNRQYDSPDKITLHDLCTWTLWPCYFKLSSELNGLSKQICLLCVVGKVYMSIECDKLRLLMDKALLDLDHMGVCRVDVGVVNGSF